MIGAPDCSAYAIGTAQAYNAPMFGSRFVHRSMHSVWRTLMCLALFAFMLRAMVPAGFMPDPGALRSEEHTSELQSLMRISYAVFCLKKKKESLIQQNNCI